MVLFFNFIINDYFLQQQKKIVLCLIIIIIMLGNIASFHFSFFFSRKEHSDFE